MNKLSPLALAIATAATLARPLTLNELLYGVNYKKIHNPPYLRRKAKTNKLSKFQKKFSLEMKD